MHSARAAPGAGQLVAGRYRLLAQLGRGAMGIVWHGRDELLDRHVAVKQIILAPMASDADARARYQRTLREARTAARLSHPGVVTVFDVVEEDGMPWIVMELVRARPLDQVIAEDGPLPPAQAAQLGLSLLDALSTAHAAGVMHRDVKPSNVLISPEGKALLTDFGIATEPAPRAPSAGPLASVIEMLLRANPAERPDAAATSRLLTTAWADARRVSYFGAGSRPPFAQTGQCDEPAAAPVDDAHPPPDPAGLEATTATQVVTVPSADTADAALDDGSSLPLAASAVGAPDSRPRAERSAAGSGADTPAEPAVAAAADVLPDLMATPVFAELKMPELPRSAAGPGVADGSGTAGASEIAAGSGTAGLYPATPGMAVGSGGLPRSRRGLVLTAPLAASAIVAGIVFLAFPGFGDSLVRSLSHGPNASKIGMHPAQNAVEGSRPRGSSEPGSGSQGGQGPAGNPQPSGPHRATGRPTSPGPSGTPALTPTQTSPPPNGGELPPGYSWQSVTAQSIETTAGFRL